MRAIFVVVLAGCWHEVAPAPMTPSPSISSSGVAEGDSPVVRRHRRPVGPDCSALGPAMEAIFNRYTGFQNAMTAILDAVTTSCVEDGWSMDLVQCFIDATDDRRAQECAGQLSPEQMKTFQERLMSAMSINAQPQPPSPPSPPPIDSAP